MSVHNPVLTVDAIEDVLTFWCDWLGCSIVGESRKDGALMAVALAWGERTVILRTASRLAARHVAAVAGGVPTVRVASMVELESCLHARTARRPPERTWTRGSVARQSVG